MVSILDPDSRFDPLDSLCGSLNVGRRRAATAAHDVDEARHGEVAHVLTGRLRELVVVAEGVGKTWVKVEEIKSSIK